MIVTINIDEKHILMARNIAKSKKISVNDYFRNAISKQLEVDNRLLDYSKTIEKLKKKVG